MVFTMGYCNVVGFAVVSYCCCDGSAVLVAVGARARATTTVTLYWSSKSRTRRRKGGVNLKLGYVPRALAFLGLSEPLRLAGLRLDEVFRLFEGLDALPEVEVSVLSVLDELCELWVNMTA